jgi:hypothetical protein
MKLGRTPQRNDDGFAIVISIIRILADSAMVAVTQLV